MPEYWVLNKIGNYNLLWIHFLFIFFSLIQIFDYSILHYIWARNINLFSLVVLKKLDFIFELIDFGLQLFCHLQILKFTHSILIFFQIILFLKFQYISVNLLYIIYIRKLILFIFHYFVPINKKFILIVNINKWIWFGFF